MIEIKKINELKSQLSLWKEAGQSIAFVPTMGALHQGHLSLLEKAREMADQTVFTIYVNPLQFNKQEDFIKYPNTLQRDLNMLNEGNCSLVYLPIQEELFPTKPTMDYDMGHLGKSMEGEFRPGHFQGMAAVVERFLRIIEPDYALFGEKDFQQYAIVNWLAKSRNLNCEIVLGETYRMENGLAYSSRNFRLNEEELLLAVKLYKNLNYCKLMRNQLDIPELLNLVKKDLEQDFDLEYFKIVDEQSFKELNDWTDSKRPRAFVAANLSGVRLIDNLSLID